MVSRQCFIKKIVIHISYTPANKHYLLHLDKFLYVNRNTIPGIF